MIEFLFYMFLFVSLCTGLFLAWYCDDIDYVPEPEDTDLEIRCRILKARYYELSKLR